jgi:hypothetical protein
VAPPTGLPRLDEFTLYPADCDYIEKITKQIKAKFADIFCGHIRVSLVSAACSNKRCFFGGRGLGRRTIPMRRPALPGVELTHRQ